MSISTLNYCETFFLKPDLTKILIIPTYNAFHQIQLDLKTKALFVHYNLGGATYGNLGLLMTDTKYSTMSNFLYVRPVHPVIILIPNNATRVASYELKRVYDKNLRVFH